MKEQTEGGPGSGRRPGGGKSATNMDSKSIVDRLVSGEFDTPEHDKFAKSQIRKKAINQKSRDLAKKIVAGVKADADGKITVKPDMIWAQKRLRRQETETSEGTMDEKKEAATGADDTQHTDVEQDKELIKKMLAEYMGDEQVSDEEMGAMESLASEAYQAHKEMGLDEAEALKQSGHAVKLARHMAKKEAAAETSEADDGEETEEQTEEKKDEQAEECNEAEGEGESESEAETKESNRVKELETKLMEANGKIAALESKTKKGEVEKHLEKMLKESKQPNHVTKMFRESVGDVKTVKELDAKWSSFLAGVKSVSERQVLDWTPIAEKSLIRESDDGSVVSGKGLDFSALAND